MNPATATPTQTTSQTVHGVHYIKFPATITESQVPALVESFRQWALFEVHFHTLDFGKVNSAPASFYKAIQGFEMQLKVRGLKMLSINMSDEIQEQIRTMNLETTFDRAKEDAREKEKSKSISESKLRKLLCKAIVEAAYEAVQVSLNSTVSCDENYQTKAESIPFTEIDLISICGCNNEFLKAEFRLYSSMKVLEKFARAMLGGNAKVDEDMMGSMALELLNMIYGHAKSSLNEKENFRLPASIPRVLKRSNFNQIRRSDASKLVVMPMVTPMGSFYIEIDFGV